MKFLIIPVTLIVLLYFSVPVQSVEEKEVKVTLEQVTTACKNTFPQEIEVCQKLLANLLIIQLDETIAALKEDQ